ncbi:MAG: hypothetical protein LiPW39_298 [Parcubacteria group bacterium LiPW_39]|nr:MAG: hypothetical protein LiPW39_298 [Parcubacteria group bacterium LiPW_39]
MTIVSSKAESAKKIQEKISKKIEELSFVIHRGNFSDFIGSHTCKHFFNDIVRHNI